MHSVTRQARNAPLFAQGLLNFPAEIIPWVLAPHQSASQPASGEQNSFSDFPLRRIWRSLKGLAERPFEISFLALVVVKCLWGLSVAGSCDRAVGF